MAYTTIDDPTIYFNTLLYTGNGSSGRSVTGVGFQPDWVWIKNRSDGDPHKIFDSVRGVSKSLKSNSTDVEASTEENGYVSAFNSDGFTLTQGSSSQDDVNKSSENYVAWNWLAGGSASSNSNGTETSNVSANTTAGFSIITYSGTTAVDTYGHGLSQKPEMMILRTRAGANRNWVVYHKDVGATKHLHLNSTAAEATDQYMFNNTEPTTSVITLSDEGEVNKSGSTYVGYIFHSVKGYSIFGSYTGNGNADGGFVYTGFKPAFVMIKKSSATQNWVIVDNKRAISNPIGERLNPNLSNAESTDGERINFLSNGFKVTTTAELFNGSGGTYIYMAFAESPFTNSNGIPNNAR